MCKEKGSSPPSTPYTAEQIKEDREALIHFLKLEAKEKTYQRTTHQWFFPLMAGAYILISREVSRWLVFFDDSESCSKFVFKIVISIGMLGFCFWCSRWMWKRHSNYKNIEEEYRKGLRKTFHDQTNIPKALMDDVEKTFYWGFFSGWGIYLVAFVIVVVASIGSLWLNLPEPENQLVQKVSSIEEKLLSIETAVDQTSNKIDDNNQMQNDSRKNWQNEIRAENKSLTKEIEAMKAKLSNVESDLDQLISLVSKKK